MWIIIIIINFLQILITKLSTTGYRLKINLIFY